MLKETERRGNPEGKSDRVKDYLKDPDKRIELKRRMVKKISELEEELRLSLERSKRIEEYEKEDFRYYLPFVGRTVPRKPRLIGGVKGHNME